LVGGGGGDFMNYKNIKKSLNQYIRPEIVYLYNLKTYFIFAVFFFVFSVVYGYGMAQSSPDEIKQVIEKLKETYEPILEAGVFEQFLMVFLNNAFVGFLTIILGVVFGLFPLFALFSNGMILGVLAFLTIQEVSAPVFFLGILPHGIIELPVMLAFVAAGLRIGHTAYYLLLKKLFPKNIQLIARDADLRRELFLALRFFFRFLAPLLLLAAAIEIFLTAALI
jgi:stage II sporulation protein M